MVTLEEVRRLLERIEEAPDYDTVRLQLGSDALPILADIVEKGDPSLAAKDAFLGFMIGSPEQSLKILQIGKQRKEPEVRVATVSGVRNIIKTAARMDTSTNEEIRREIESLSADSDPGVRKEAAKTLNAT
jgi:hypothetical protein